MRKFLMVGVLALVGSQANAQYVVNGNCPSCQNYRPVGKVEQATYNVVGKTADVVYETKERVKGPFKKFGDKISEVIENRPRIFGRRCK